MHDEVPLFKQSDSISAGACRGLLETGTDVDPREPFYKVYLIIHGAIYVACPPFMVTDGHDDRVCLQVLAGFQEARQPWTFWNFCDFC